MVISASPTRNGPAEWFRRSAENGYAFAMFSLALLYRDGSGVARDDIEAHKWFDLASALNFDPRAQFQRDLIARRMTSEQIVEAQRRAQEWINAFFFGHIVGLTLFVRRLAAGRRVVVRCDRVTSPGLIWTRLRAVIIRIR